MAALPNPKHEAFCLEYMKDRNATAAYIRAGYSAKTANQNVHGFMLKYGIPARIAELEAEYAAEAGFEATDVLKRWVQIATADRNELTSIEVAACRWCHGADHAYQWRTRREFEAALSAWSQLPDAKRAAIPMPTDEGGYGFTTRAAPVETCPECDGRGAPYTRLRDTTTLSEAGRAIYAGVEETQHGVKIKTLEADHALDQIARHLGMFDKDNRRTVDVSDRLADLLDQINAKGSSAALTAARRAPPGEDSADE